MRKRYERQRLAAGMVAFGLIGPAAVADGQADGPEPPAKAPSTRPAPGAERAAAVATARAGHPIAGLEVRNRSGEHLGVVDSVLVDPHGQVTAVILARGGLFGLGAERRRVPWERVNSPRGDHLVVDVPKSRIDAEFSAFEPERASH